MDPVVPLLPNLVSVVQFEGLCLTQKMIECLGTEQRRLWFVRALRARQEGRYEC
jgi:hypothetical protein